MSDKTRHLEKSSVSAADFARDELASLSSIGDGVNVEGGRRFTVASAAYAAQADKEQTVRQSIQSYPVAIFWSLLVSMLVIMEGKTRPLFVQDAANLFAI
jgi:hypothetical protein